MDFYVQIAIFLITLMFIISGFDKVLTLGESEMLRLSNKTGLSLTLAKYIVLFAGIYELISSGMILYGSYYNNVSIATNGTIALIIFILLATLIFYTFPLKYKPLMSNLSVMSGLYLMMNVCFFKNETLF
jgi:hypothetical protein